MKNRIVLKLKKIDFISTEFGSTCNCAIAKAIKRQLKVKNVSEGVCSTTIEKINYSHDHYLVEDFEQDRTLAEIFKKNNQIVREIILEKV